MDGSSQPFPSSPDGTIDWCVTDSVSNLNYGFPKEQSKQLEARWAKLASGDQGAMEIELRVPLGNLKAGRWQINLDAMKCKPPDSGILLIHRVPVKACPYSLDTMYNLNWQFKHEDSGLCFMWSQHKDVWVPYSFPPEQKRLRGGYMKYLEGQKVDSRCPINGRYIACFQEENIGTPDQVNMATRPKQVSVDGGKRSIIVVPFLWFWDSRPAKKCIRGEPPVWTPYPVQTCEELEEAYVNPSKPTCEIAFDGGGKTFRYQINFSEMTQSPAHDQYRKRAIKREGPQVLTRPSQRNSSPVFDRNLPDQQPTSPRLSNFRSPDRNLPDQQPTSPRLSNSRSPNPQPPPCVPKTGTTQPLPADQPPQPTSTWMSGQPTSPRPKTDPNPLLNPAKTDPAQPIDIPPVVGSPPLSGSASASASAPISGQATPLASPTPKTIQKRATNDSDTIKKTDSDSAGSGFLSKRFSLNKTWKPKSPLRLVTWKNHGAYYSRKIPQSDKEFKWFTGLLADHFELGQLIVEQLYAVYNPTRTAAFVANGDTVTRRYKTAHDTFFKQDWVMDDLTKLDQRAWVAQEYQKRAKLFDFHNGPLPIVPVLHGTRFSVAEKICDTGFAALSSMYDLSQPTTRCHEYF